jgi:hypothetical protein
MSQHMSKERRHKEASLADVTSVVAGPPAKRKPLADGESESVYVDNCLTINFRKGGGIDLQFSSKQERDEWLDALTTIFLQLTSSNSGE